MQRQELSGDSITVVSVLQRVKVEDRKQHILWGLVADTPFIPVAWQTLENVV